MTAGGQDADEPLENPALHPSVHPRVGIITASRSSEPLTSRLSRREPSPVVTTRKALPNLPSLPSPLAASRRRRLAFHAGGLSRPAAAHRTVTFTTPLIRQGYLNLEFYCFFTTGYLKDRIFFSKTNYGDF